MALEFYAHEESGLETFVFDGHERVLACLPSDMEKLCAAHPKTYEDTFDVIPRSLWPDKFSSKKWFPFMWDQDGQGACEGHGSTAAFTAKWNSQGKILREFSPTYAYSLVNGGRDNGATPEDGDAAFKTKGVCLRSTVGPMKSFRNSYDTKAADVEAARFKTEQTYRVTTIEGAVSAIIREHMLFDGIFCGNHYEPDSQGNLPEYRGGGGGHCMARLGYELRNSRVWFEKPNSWGLRWGLKGWCYEPQSYLEAGLKSFGAIAIVSCLEDPENTIKVK